MYELLRDEQKEKLEYLRHQLIEVLDCFEELYYYGTSWGWTPRYCIKRNKVVSTLHLLPGVLEGSVGVNALILETIRQSPDILDEHKKLVEQDDLFTITKWISMELTTDRHINSYLALCKIKKEYYNNG